MSGQKHKTGLYRFMLERRECGCIHGANEYNRRYVHFNESLISG